MKCNQSLNNKNLKAVNQNQNGTKMETLYFICELETEYTRQRYVYKLKWCRESHSILELV